MTRQPAKDTAPFLLTALAHGQYLHFCSSCSSPSPWLWRGEILWSSIQDHFLLQLMLCPQWVHPFLNLQLPSQQVDISSSDFWICISNYILNIKTWDVPGSPVFTTPRFHCSGHRFNPWSGNWDPACHALWGEKNHSKTSTRLDIIESKIRPWDACISLQVKGRN